MKNLKFSSLALIIILMMPFMQLGVSFYISTAFLLFCYAFITSIRIYDKQIYIGLLLSCILLVIKALMNSADTVGSREVLLPLREMLCFLGFIFISSRIKNEEINPVFLNKLILIYLIVILLLISYQTYRLLGGGYFGFPIKYYVLNQATLTGVDEALFHQTRFRPTSFYGEPSYTAFVVLSLLVLSFKTLKTFNSKILYAFLALSIVAISQSLAGVVAIFFIISYWVLFSQSKVIGGIKVAAFVVILSLGVLVGLYFSDEIYLRLASTLAGQDASSNTRITEPLMLLVDVISKGSFFGVNFQYIERFLGYPNLDNALLRMFIYYGVLIILPLVIVCFHAGNGLLVLYMLLAMFFNGEFFSYDKVLVVGMVVGLSKAKFTNISKNDRHSRSLQPSR